MALTIDLASQVVVVTGGTKGVGRGIAQRFADAGARLAVVARSTPSDFPADWYFVSADLRDPDAAFAAIDAVVAHFGRVDCVVNNAGGSPPAETATASPRLSERIVALNLLAPLYVSQRANFYMQKQETGGSIVNIGSVTALRPAPTTAAYGAAKAGLMNLTMTLALEWAPKVRVNAVTAGMIRTEQSHVFYGDEDGIARVSATIPLGRLAMPEEIGDVAVWLASPLASYVSGSNVLAHGGGERPPFLDAATG